MVNRPPTTEPHKERPGPAEFRDPLVLREMQRASVWFGIAIAIAGVIYLSQPLLLIVGGLLFAVLLDGGVRLLGRWLPIPRGWRLMIVLCDRLRLPRLGGVVRGHRHRRPVRSPARRRHRAASPADRLRRLARPDPEGRGDPRRRGCDARRSRPPDERARQRRRGNRQLRRDDRDRHLPRFRAAAVRSRYRLDASSAASDRLLPDRRACRLHASTTAVRPDDRHGLRRRVHLVHARPLAASRWRGFSGS